MTINLESEVIIAPLLSLYDISLTGFYISYILHLVYASSIFYDLNFLVSYKFTFHIPLRPLIQNVKLSFGLLRDVRPLRSSSDDPFISIYGWFLRSSRVNAFFYKFFLMSFDY